MGIIHLKTVIQVIEAYNEMNTDEQAEFRKIMGLRAEGETYPGVRP